MVLTSFIATAQSRRKPDLTPLALFPLRTAWTLTLEARLRVAPAYAGLHAYFSTDDGRLVSYDLRQGKPEWSVAATPQLDPVAGQGLIFLVETGRLIARQQSDGNIAWEVPWSEELSTSPVWDNEWLVVATKSGAIVAFRASDGTTIWRRELASPAHIPPALAADRVYVATEDSRVVSLQITTGEPVWTRKLGGIATGLRALDEQVFAGSTDNYFYCLTARNGQVDWRWRAGADPVGQPVVDDKNVYFVALDNVLRALSRAHGVQQWVRLLPLRPTRGPLLAGSTLVVTGIAPTLRAYNVKDGQPAGDLATAGEVSADPYPLAGSLPQVLVVTRDIAKGAVATLITRQIEPRSSAVTPLPNPVPLPPLPRPSE
jgi:outer membrane protein assembly factor BamB